MVTGHDGIILRGITGLRPFQLRCATPELKRKEVVVVKWLWLRIIYKIRRIQGFILLVKSKICITHLTNFYFMSIILLIQSLFLKNTK